MAPPTTRVALAVALALAAAGPAADPARLFGTNPRTDQRFDDAVALEKAERWAEAVDLYLRIADESGDDLVAANADKRHLIPARALVQRRLAARRELLGPYRDRVEGRTRKQLDAADPLDPKPLARIVASAFCTRTAETALHRLGDLACEAGDFAAARRWWAMLLPPTRPDQLGYPDPTSDAALVRAKIILARLLAGETSEARADVEAFRRDHAGAAGHLAGRGGNLLATLQRLLDSPATLVAAVDARPPEPTTFGLDPTRNAVLTGRLPAYAPEARYPPVLLPEASPRLEDRLTQQMLVKPAALAFHPLVVSRRIFVADANSVNGFDLDSGARFGRLTLDRAGHRLPTLDTKLPSATDVRYTLTAAGDRIFARLGQPRVRSDRADADSYLVCARVAPDGGLKLAWSLPALKPDDASVAVWEGTPLVRDGRLFAAVTRLDGNRAVTAVVCYDPSEPQPMLVWQQDVLEAAAEMADRTQHLLLTLAGPSVVFGPHAGAIIALDAATGKRAWAARYDAADPKAEPADAPFRELGPCVAAGGTLYAAPTDAERVYAFDAATGASLWRSDPLTLSHLLGVARGVVVGQRGGSVAGLSALDAATGRLIPGWGYAVFGGDAVAPFGRGLMAADRVYWPTRASGVREIRLDGTVEYPPTSFQNLPGGNLAYGDGGLLVATEDRLHVLLPPKADGDGTAVKRGMESLGWRDRFPPSGDRADLAAAGKNDLVPLDGATVRSPDGLVIGARDRRVVAFEGRTGGRAVWSRDIDGASNLTGAPIRLRLCGGALLVGVPRNDGFEIECLDVRTGRPRPDIGIVEPGDPFKLSAAVVIDGRLLVANGSRLSAYESGRQVWRRPLDAPGPWRLEAADGLAVCWPLPSPRSPPLTNWPVLAVAADGRVLARWEFGRPGANGEVSVADGAVTVASENGVRREKLPSRRGEP